MDASALISALQESLFVIVVLLLFISLAMIKGRQTLINLIMGLYLALLISLEFPYYSYIVGGSGSSKTTSVLMVIVFIVFTFLSYLLFNRLMPREYDEKAFEGFGKKFLYAILATILVVIYSYHALPVTDLVDPGSPVASIFGSESSFFWWLLVPLVTLFFL
ncbi:hypothetical protein H6783_02840 [Candidatus Nomurabacteria bacterium]|nr:hypothetical protein [Candidatus Nomurabacteria bacterium]